MKKKVSYFAGHALFIIYSAIMLYLLLFKDRFFWSLGLDELNYWELVRHNVNLRPFKTIGSFLKVLLNNRYDVYDKIAIENLLGNIILFIPLGFFLPWLYKGCKKALGTFFWTIIIITCVEATQTFLLLGAGDIDDLILNTVGSMMGFAIFVLIKKILLAKSKTN